MQVICGINPLREIIRSQPTLLERLFVAAGRGGEEVRQIVQLASERGIPVEVCPRQRVEQLAPAMVHQGILGVCREYAYADLEQLIANRHPESTHDLVIILDGITDPQNLGSVIRTAYCCGANGVIIPENRAASVTAAVVKASAGAAYLLPTAMVVNLSRTIEYLQEKGFWIYGADAAAKTDHYSPDYAGHVGLVMGSEGRGIRPLIRKKCDFLISVPLRGRISSLNVSVATGVILYEILRTWGKGA